VKNWGKLCWFGSLNNQAQDVMFACEKAVKLKPNDGKFRRYRGLARALTGNYQGAIDDFQLLVESIEDEDKKAIVEGWIETLKKGENPFTSEVLEEFKNNR
jgi:regulator of sirC expression with transglutaminase-like and TPR domain